MTIVAKLKKLVPKTPKGWVIAGLGTSAAALTLDYAVRKDGSIVAGLLHKLHGGGGQAPHPQQRGRVPQPGTSPQMPTSPMMYGGPQMMQPVFVEPTMASNFGYRFQHHHDHYDHYEHAPYGMHPQHFGHHANPYEAMHHAYDRVHDAAPPPHHDTYLYGGGTTNPYNPYAQHPLHVAGAASDEPHAPKQSKAKIPPPGAYGIVSTTPQADGVVMGEFGSTDAPCGPGLFYDAVNKKCIPMPTTPPYGWQEQR